MDYKLLYDSFGKGKAASLKRADYWRRYEPYCYRINEETNTAYPVNRYYRPLGNPKESVFVKPPPYTLTIYVYNDGTKPFESKRDCLNYAVKIEEITSKYDVSHFYPLCNPQYS